MEQIIAPALPLSRPVRGRVSSHRGSYLTPQQEAAQRLDDITKFPQQTGYLWVRAAGANAILMRSHTLKPIPNQNTSLSTHNSSLDTAQIRHDLEEEARKVMSAASPAPRYSKSKSKNKVVDILTKLERQMQADEDTHPTK